MAVSAGITILLALLSAGGRATLNVIDRQTFNHLQIAVLPGSAVNNGAPAVVALAVVPFVGVRLFVDALVDYRACVFAGIAQVVAILYGWAFRTSPVPRVVLFSKLPDIAIPAVLFLTTGVLDWHN